MFEDLQSDQQSGVPVPGANPISQQPPVLPTSKPVPITEPEDILADVETVPASTPKQPPIVQRPPMGDIGPAQPLTDLSGIEVMDTKHRSSGKRKIIYIAGGLAIAIIIVVLIMFISSSPSDDYEIFVNEPIDNTQNENQDNVEETDEMIDNTGGVVEETVIDPTANLDEDGDGLTNEQETIIGTDPFNPDSDNDGLFDREEVVTYRTDPLNEDSDGDGYLDGSEVKSGYNPSGPGELLQLPLEED